MNGSSDTSQTDSTDVKGGLPGSGNSDSPQSPFSPASASSVSSSPVSASDDITLVANSAGKKVPKVIHYQPQRGTFDETTAVNGDSGSSTFRGVSSLASAATTASSSAAAAAQARVSQLQYNHNRVALDRSINTAAEFVHELRQENKTQPIHYPMTEDPDLDARLNSRDSRIAIMRQKSYSDSPEPTSTSEDSPFQILKIFFRFDPASGDVVGNLDKGALASLIDDKLSQVLRHLSSLKDRIDDTSSKVLVTGDLNSGKSAFCNALLRREVLPEDQEPCTSVFCEIIDALENDGVEEVHAVPIGSKYDIDDHRTFCKFQVSDLGELVYEAKTYSLLVIYVKDSRPPEQSLLRNGVIDIKLIDAPGLNLDSYHTTQLYSRQEEIDLVVFVVNAENHFTLSGREFISSAANDKNLIFVVVNKFDQIKNKDRCRGMIMQQLQPLSPETFKNADEFVHFVSAQNAIKPDGDPKGDPDEPDNNGDGRPDFDRLEASLRNFILEKRSLSKLLPAKTYLCKLYDDIARLAEINEKLYKDSRSAIKAQFDEVSPQYKDNVQNSVKVNEAIMKLIEDSSEKAYDYSRAHIREVIDGVGQAPLGVAFKGYSDISRFAISTQEGVINRILESVAESEDFARNNTSCAIDDIRRIGRQYLDEGSMPATKFVPEAMYSRKRDLFQRRIDTTFSFTDFVDPSLESFCKVCGVKLPSRTISAVIWAAFSKLWKTGLSGLVVMYGPHMFSTMTGIQSMSSLLPQAVTKKVLPWTVMGICIGLPIYYFYKDAPRAYQRKVVKKIKKELENEDYLSVNSLRISKEVRKVLNYPANDVSIGLNALIETSNSKRAKLIREMKKGESCTEFYGELIGRVKQQRNIVESYDLIGVD
ncbi:hypothetical protein FOA43_004062 [Brettanomyces nanus]|uniref:Dynamin-type G domain-containing protein n=1 Tax=Eeniella nana TaxID=13502 RepID=A0A875S6U5_EENNA|nr:uncharacterized protein FOA43_004062 [Brettanomyces nanus]QPG76668.1 hypothetical protein FOA43_004062 [Brettanomyces nanus]